MRRNLGQNDPPMSIFLTKCILNLHDWVQSYGEGVGEIGKLVMLFKGVEAAQ